METSEFIRQHINDDIRTLALMGKHFPKVDLPYALDQIRGHQLARTKLPTWTSTEGIVYPPHLNMEQCSSEQTALYKQNIVRRLLQKLQTKNNATLIDLTGGFGVDFSYMSIPFNKAVYVERNKQLYNIATHNFECLKLHNISAENKDSIDVLHKLNNASIIFLDPVRRNSNGKKVISIADCEPNVRELCDELVEKCDFTIIKLSPMLDWHNAVEQLKYVIEVHIISVKNECKELLMVLANHKKEKQELKENSIKIFCVNNNDIFYYEEEVNSSEENTLQLSKINKNALSTLYLYEPNASIMKAGCFALLSKTYNVAALSNNSHLFVSPVLLSNFPGRRFRIMDICTLNKKEIRHTLTNITRANIAVRNFPIGVDALRKRLKLHDGGDNYIFATTYGEKEHILIISKKEV